MARLPRYVILGQPQHIIQRGNNRQTIFVAEADYTFFRDALIEAALKHGLRVHTLCGCQSHPFAGPPPDYEDSLGKIFQSVGRRYVQYSTILTPEAARCGKGATGRPSSTANGIY